jgi:hypothetical protein
VEHDTTRVRHDDGVRYPACPTLRGRRVRAARYGARHRVPFPPRRFGPR